MITIKIENDQILIEKETHFLLIQITMTLISISISHFNNIIFITLKFNYIATKNLILIHIYSKIKNL